MASVCAVVPVFDHERAIGQVVASLRQHGLTVFLVDDGSGPSCAAELDRLARADAQVRLLRLSENQGKGAAVMAGLTAAASEGFSHALQIDADGQHDSSGRQCDCVARFHGSPRSFDHVREHPGVPAGWFRDNLSRRSHLRLQHPFAIFRRARRY